MAQFNRDDPRYQRDLQRVRSARSMGPGYKTLTGRRANRGVLSSAIGEVTGKHAGYQQARQQAFERLAQSKKSSDISYGLNKSRLRYSDKDFKLRERAFDAEREMMPYAIGGGLLSAIGSGYEGYRRSEALKKSTALKERRHQEIIDQMRGYSYKARHPIAGYGGR